MLKKRCMRGKVHRRDQCITFANGGDEKPPDEGRAKNPRIQGDDFKKKSSHRGSTHKE